MSYDITKLIYLFFTSLCFSYLNCIVLCINLRKLLLIQPAATCNPVPVPTYNFVTSHMPTYSFVIFRVHFVVFYNAVLFCVIRYNINRYLFL